MTVIWSDAQLEHRDAHFVQAGQVKLSPESTSRVTRIVDTLRDRGKKLIQPAEFGLDPILAVHDEGYVAFLKSAYDRWVEIFGPDKMLMPNVHPIMPYDSRPDSVIGQLGWYTGDMACEITKGTWRAAYQSAQAAVDATRHTMAEGVTHYALCRPPGHHAFSARAMGFCYLNNAAIAARALCQKFDHVAILDVDVHHGNGTQEIFYDCADVFTLSIHSHPKEYYPFFSGYPSERGVGDGEGYNLNVPFEFGADDGPFMKALESGLEAVHAYAPDAIVLALGVDGSEHDPHGQHNIGRTAFATMAKQVRQLARPTVIIQEGGYESAILGDLVADVLDVFEV